MRRFLFLLFFALGACLAQTSESRMLALLVGVDEYVNTQSLRCCVNDMKALKTALIKLGVRENDIIMLTTGGSLHNMPTKEKIEQKVAEIRDAAQPDDIVFIALSGHGARENEIDYFCPPFANSKNIEGTCVSITKVMDDLTQCKSQFKLIVVDACRSAPNVRDARAFEVIPTSPDGITLFQSCNKGEVSLEEKRVNGNGYFTKNLVAALSGKADLNQDGKLTLLEVCNWTSDHTKAEVKKMENKIQTPFLKLSTTDFTLSVDPNFSKAEDLAALARAAMEAKNYDLAIEKYKMALELYPNNAQWKRDLELALIYRPKSNFNPMKIVVPDDFTTIEEAYKNIKDGGFITVLPGKYELSEMLVINRTITFRGSAGRPEDVVIDCPTSTAFKITGGSPSFQNLTVSSGGEKCVGFFVTNGTPKLFRCIITSRKGIGMYVTGEKANPQVDSCTFKNCGGNGVHVNAKGLGTYNDCEIYSNAFPGIAVAKSGNPTFIECKIHDGKSNGVYVSNNGLGKFTNCEIYSNAFPGIAVVTSGNPTVTGCKIHDGKQDGVWVKENGLGKFSDCDIYGNAFTGIDVETSGNPTVTGCKIHDGKDCGVHVSEKGLGSFTDCDIYANSNSGIQIKESGNPTVTGCKIHDGKANGVWVLKNGLGKFKDCEIYANAMQGISVSTSGDPTFTGCKIHDGKDCGVYIFDKGTGTFNNNTLEKNYWNGTLDNWHISANAGEVKGSGNTPPIPKQLPPAVTPPRSASPQVNAPATSNESR